MKKIILIITCLFLCGCSFLPKFDFTGSTVPQSIDTNKYKEKCSGKVEFYEDGSIKSCSKGYYNYKENYNKQERKTTIVERVKDFINTILSWGIPGLIIICIIFPGAFTLIGTFIGRFIEGTWGVGVTVGKRLMKAIQKTRKEGKDLNQSLEAELDTKDKEYIKRVKDKENIK